MSTTRTSAASTSATSTNPRSLRDAPVDVKVVLSGLWVAMLFVFAYVDIFGFWRADIVRGALDGEVPGVGFEINQTFLVLTTLYVVVPSLMVAFSLLAPARVSRPVTVGVAVGYLASVIASMVGETWTYYLVGSTVEVVLLLMIARTAWSWPRGPMTA